MGEEFCKFAIGDGCQQGLAAGEVVVDGHGGNADGVSDATHADGVGAFLFEDRKGNLSDTAGSVIVTHLYSV